MRKKSMSSKDSAEKTVRDIRRKTRRHRSSEEKIRVVLSGLRGEESIAALCRREGIGLVPQKCRIPISFTLPPFQTREGFSRLASNVCVVDCRSH